MSQEQLTRLVRLLKDNERPKNPVVGEMRARMEELGEKFPPPDDAVVQRVFVNGLSAEWVVAPGADDTRTILYLHGGGYVQGSPYTHRNLAYHFSKEASARVLVLDYRMAPEHPFPAAVDDAVSAWRWLLAQGNPPARLALAGDSAGGGLAVSAMVSLRYLGLPLPAACVCISPWADLEGTGESVITKADEDPMVTAQGLQWYAKLYLDGADPRAPLASPIYADLTGLPPLLIQVGSAEILLDDASRLAAAAGSKADLRVWQDMVHVWHLFQPMLAEGGEAIAEAGKWLQERWT